MDDTNNLFTLIVPRFLSATVCRELIEASEHAGYVSATTNEPAGNVVNSTMRNNSRAVVDDPKTTALLNDAARPLLPPEFAGCQLLGLHPRLRYYRYGPGERFKMHFDAPTKTEDGESRLTFIIYLNDECEGGETALYCRDHTLRLWVKPETGKLLVFAHRQLHEGREVTVGIKYILRTDVMYGKHS